MMARALGEVDRLEDTALAVGRVARGAAVKEKSKLCGGLAAD